ncbi:hypothetical protein LCGC14_0765860 [marine sediment metagenome]|uniref:DUF362 domain-containing protein n=1 Tax=marine sediment metagenome TaxID=412755 RepID=A0A0F9Q407_9ZZZZ
MQENNNTTITDASIEPIEDTLRTALQFHGGLKKFISEEDQVLLKPNFNTGDPFPASTDPDFLLTAAKLVLELTPNVSIIESSMFRLKTEDVINKIMGDRLKKLEIPLITELDFQYTEIDLKSLGAQYLKKVKLPSQVLDPETKIILLPCLKTHFVAHYTGALKLAVGFMEKKQRIRLHMSRRVPEKVAELNLGYKPDLIIMDARKIFVTKGPMNGKIEFPNSILVGTNRTSIDIEGVKIIQSYGADNKLQDGKPKEVRTVKRALELEIE